MTFALTCLLWTLGLAMLTAAVAAGGLLWPGFWRGLPRHRPVGALLGVVCLAWAAWQAQFLLEGNLERFRLALWVAVPVLALLSYFFLDFLFARALGGLVLLVVPQLLDQAFAQAVRGRPLFSVGCYLCGILGMLLVATPWHFRNLLQRCEESPAWRRTVLAAGGCATLFFALFAVCG